MKFPITVHYLFTFITSFWKSNITRGNLLPCCFLDFYQLLFPPKYICLQIYACKCPSNTFKMSFWMVPLNAVPLSCLTTALWFLFNLICKLPWDHNMERSGREMEFLWPKTDYQNQVGFLVLSSTSMLSMSTTEIILILAMRWVIKLRRITFCAHCMNEVWIILVGEAAHFVTSKIHCTKHFTC